jgi:hypothetical protein
VTGARPIALHSAVGDSDAIDRRIGLLAIARSANVVVIGSKRDGTGPRTCRGAALSAPA